MTTRLVPVTGQSIRVYEEYHDPVQKRSALRYDRLAFGIGATLDVRLKRHQSDWSRFDIHLGWSACGGTPGDALAQATIIRQLAERGAIAQCIAREHGAEWTSAEIETAVAVLREERRQREASVRKPKIDVPDTVEKLAEAVSMIAEALPASEKAGEAIDFIVNHLGDEETQEDEEAA